MLERRGAIEGERKQVTVMYTDVVGSMALAGALDGERWGYVLDRFLAVAAAAVHRFEGTISHFTGDGLLAVFGAPLAHEDHARRACLAVLELEIGVAELAAEVARDDGAEFATRCGLNSGEVVVGRIGDDVHMDFVPIGNTTALGKRIETLAPAGSAAISAATAALVEGEFELRDLGEFELKGVSGPQRALELVGPSGARTRLEAAAATRGLAHFVGRESERAELEAALEQALDGHGRALGIVGDPGVGKSRLVREFVADCTARGIAVSASGCLPHGRDVPLLPMLALYRDLFEISESDAPEIARRRIEATLGTGDPGLAADLPLLFEFLGIPAAEPGAPVSAAEPRLHHRRLRRLLARILEARGHAQATVLIVEDLHWIDGASAAFLESLIDVVAGTRILLITTFRPEYDERWSPHGRLSLNPLDAGASGDLLAELVGQDPSLAGLTRLIDQRADGNPFFIEEMVQAVVEAGYLAGTRGDYRLAAEVEVEDVVVPPTVQATLAARIDRLPEREKELAQTMSVIGVKIPARVLSEASGLGEDELAAAVAALTAAQIVVAAAAGDDAYVFKHPLTRDVAYRSQLSGRRAQTHREVAAAIERSYPEGLDERAALLAHHHELAGEGLVAAAWEIRAAGWVKEVATAESMRHWRRARVLAQEAGKSPEADALAGEALTGILQLAWRLGMTPEETATIREQADAGAGQVRTDPHYAGFLFHSGHEREGLEAFRDLSGEAIVAADPGRILTAATGVAFASWIAGALSEGVETLERAMPLADGDPMLGSGLAFISPIGHAHGSLALCLGYMGELESARDHFERGAELLREHSDSANLAHNRANLALVEADAGDLDAAIRNAAEGLAISERMDDAIGVIACSAAAASAQADSGSPAEALAAARSNLIAIRRRQIGLYYEPMLLATIARSQLALGDGDAALAAAEEGVGIMDARGLTACALRAPITLAQALIAAQGDSAGERIEATLSHALKIVRASGARAFEPRIQSELGVG